LHWWGERPACLRRFDDRRQDACATLVLVRRRSPDRAVWGDRKVSRPGRQTYGRGLCAVGRPAHNGRFIEPFRRARFLQT
jgi:hypothetical protein